MKRLEAIRRMKAEKFKTLDEKILEDQQKDIDEDIKAADAIEREGTMAAKNIVLEEMEKKLGETDKTRGQTDRDLKTVSTER